MKDDYLWDKTGEPDTEIERLEQLLGDLRYRRPRAPLPLPQRAPENARSFRPALAIAAAVSFVMVAAGLWFALGLRQQEAAGVAAINAQPGSARDWLNPNSLTAQAAVDDWEQPSPARVEKIAQRTDARRRSVPLKRREQQASSPRLANSTSIERDERISMDEGLAAREQLIKALHLASVKLNQVQKKIKDTKSPVPIS